MRSVFVGLVAVLLLVITACSTSPTTTSPAPTAASTLAPAASTSVTSSTPAASITGAPSIPAAVDTTPAPAASARSTAASTGSVKLDIQPTSRASYIAKEEFAGKGFYQATGTTSSISGSIVLENGNVVNADQSKLTVNLTTFNTDDKQRDQTIARMFRRNPNAVFVVQGVTGVASPMPTSGSATFKLIGDMTINGVTKQVAWDVNATFDVDMVSGTATTEIKFSDFGMQTPRTFIVLSVEDTLGLKIDFTMKATGNAETEIGRPM
ncbi:MAG: hypothetical protein EXR67_03620 [Dehalococcoidia bacterium]|nr:hypothetical protein [Dehalococcoidia bacterium]